MKKLIYFVSAVLFITTTSTAVASTFSTNGTATLRQAENRYIFMEGGIEFSVYPDGEFDFVIPAVIDNLNINFYNDALNLSYNSGFNYDAYVQYDQYGAVIQIADVPVYYDNWGRMVQAGNVAVNYRNNRIVAVGGLQVFYSGNAFAHTRGYINPYNRRINHYPYTHYFYRPYVDRCLVYATPYRRLYTPQRFSYSYHSAHYRDGFSDGYANAYRDFNRPQGRVAHNNARSGSYRDARNATSRNTSQSNTYAATSRSGRNTVNTRSSRSTVSDQKNMPSRSSTARSIPAKTESSRVRSSTERTNNGTSAVRSSRSNTIRNASERTSNGSQRTTAPSRSRTQPATPVTMQSNRKTQNNAGRTTSSRSSRSSTTRSSRSGGN